MNQGQTIIQIVSDPNLRTIDNIITSMGMLHVLSSAYLMVFFAFWVMLIGKRTLITATDKQVLDVIPIETGYFFTGQNLTWSALWSTMLFGLSVTIMLIAYILIIFLVGLGTVVGVDASYKSEILMYLLYLELAGVVLLSVPGYIRYMLEDSLGYIPPIYADNLNHIKRIEESIQACKDNLSNIELVNGKNQMNLNMAELKDANTTSIKYMQQQIRIYKLYNFYYESLIFNCKHASIMGRFFRKWGSVYKITLFKDIMGSYLRNPHAGMLLDEDRQAKLFKDLPL